MTLLRTVYELFPPKTREKIKLLLGTHGHGASRFDALKARDHAQGKKRLDRTAAALTPILAGAGIKSLRDRDCLEFGAGYAPTETLIFYLLGARAAVATDYNPIARLDMLVEAARSADRVAVLDLLGPFADGLDIEQRLDLIVKNDAALAKRVIVDAIQYIAPHDMSTEPLCQQFDLIHSVSVFEHLPPLLVEPILSNLVRTLAPGGNLLTEIDLRDHLDFDNGPLAFLGSDDSYDPQADFDRRGNRLRLSEWRDIFNRQVALETREVYSDSLPHSALPSGLSITFCDHDADDLVVSWVGLASSRL